MMQTGNWMRRAALALRKNGWTVLCSAAIGLLPAASSFSAQAAQVKTAKAGKVSTQPAARSTAKGKSRAHGKSQRSRARAASRSGRYSRAAKTADIAVPSLLSDGDQVQVGLHDTSDALRLRSSVALVVDQDSNQVLLNKNDQAVLPIASLTKLMTGLLVSEAKLPLDQPVTITPEDVDTEKRSRSRLAVGTTLTRGELLHLALMSSENRAAHALGRTYPGGLDSFVALMNARATALGMKDTHYIEPTGLSSDNRSSASDLAKLVAAAARDPLLRELTTSRGYEVAVGRRVLQFNNTNRLVKNPQWDIGLQKTGYISEAGDCLVMQTRIAGRRLIMVFLDSASKFSRIADAERVRRWVEARAQSDTPRIGLVAERVSS
jgi:D-alanyl-D-alanine endopeptidase (penicillin-binding protein 7)